MKTEIEGKLHRLLDERDQAKKKSAEQAALRQSAEEKNLEDFFAKRDSVIRPALQEIVTLYQSRGIFARIEETSEGEHTSAGPSRQPTIGIDLAGPNFHNQVMKPHFTFYFYKESRKLMLHTSTGSQAGPAGDLPLDSISTDWIHEAFLKYEGVQ